MTEALIFRSIVVLLCAGALLCCWLFDVIDWASDRLTAAIKRRSSVALHAKPEWHEYVQGESLEDRQARRLMACPILDSAEREVLFQLRKITWDGDLVSKTARDSLVKRGFATRWNGYQVVTWLGMAWIETVFPKKMAEMERR